MKIKDGFELRDVCGEHIIVAYGEENIDFSKVISLNESAAYLWRAVEGQEFSTRTLVSLLCKEYDVDEPTATADIDRMLQDWQAAGLVQV